MATVRDRLIAAVETAEATYHRLVLLVGHPRSGKTRALLDLEVSRGWSRVNLNRELAARLIDCPKRQRPLKLPDLAAQVIGAYPGPVLLLDNLELLFAPELAVDPLRLLQTLSRNRAVVASWRGTYDGEHLTYAEPGHPEWRRYTRPDAVMVTTTYPAAFPADTSQGAR